MEDDLQWKTNSNGRLPPMEDEQKYWNGNIFTILKCLKLKQPPMEDNVKYWQWNVSTIFRGEGPSRDSK